MGQSNQKKVLIVEDEVDLLDMYEDLLKGTGLDVVTAKDGEEGLKILEKGGIDLVLLDLMMPGMDGFSALKMIKKNPIKYGTMPVIILTALISDVAIKETYEMKADAYIGKDMSPEEFIEMVEKYLKKKKGKILEK